MDCKISLVKVLIAGLILTLLLMAVSGCAPRSEKQEASASDADGKTTEVTEKTGLPTYERNPSGNKIPSETRFGDGDYGKREELSDVEP